MGVRTLILFVLVYACHVSFTSPPIGEMNGHGSIGRRRAVPILYTRGTHYEVGFDVGRTFGSLIKSFLEHASSLNNEYIPLYETEKGRKVYELTLSKMRQRFPQYVREIEGTAEGAAVPFYKLFLLQMDDVMSNVAGQKTSNDLATGCSSVCLNEPGSEVLGHTEDALAETLNHFYIVSADIICDEPQGVWKVKEEHFTSLCYAGHLPGYTMGFNHHGLVFSINTLSARTLRAGRTPRTFLTRALLAANEPDTLERVLADEGCGAADGCSINYAFLDREGDQLIHNAEIAPPHTPAQDQDRTLMNVLVASPGEYLTHCNIYQRLKVPEVDGLIINSSHSRLKALKKFGHPRTKDDVINMLSDQDPKEEYTVFQDRNDDDFVKTIAVGVFDLTARTWSLYTNKPNSSKPNVVLPIHLKGQA